MSTNQDLRTHFGSQQFCVSPSRDAWCTVNAAGMLTVDSQYNTIECRLSDCLPYGAGDQHTEDNRVAYRVARYLFDTPELARAHIKFDITTLLTARIGGELPRTRGHYHLAPEGRERPFFDVYQVHLGHIIVQVHARLPSVPFVGLLIAEPEDILFLPPSLCHVVYNVGSTPAVFSNWCTRADHLDYDSMRATNGPALRILEWGEHAGTVVRNSAFGFSPQPRLMKPIPPELVCRRAGTFSTSIFDWQSDAAFVAALNDPPTGDDWLSVFYECDSSVDLDVRAASS